MRSLVAQSQSCSSVHSFTFANFTEHCCSPIICSYLTEDVSTQTFFSFKTILCTPLGSHTQLVPVKGFTWAHLQGVSALNDEGCIQENLEVKSCTNLLFQNTFLCLPLLPVWPLHSKVGSKHQLSWSQWGEPMQYYTDQSYSQSVYILWKPTICQKSGRLLITHYYDVILPWVCND